MHRGAAAAERDGLEHGRSAQRAADERGGRLEQQHAIATSGGRGIGVRRRPGAAVDVQPIADAHRREDRRDRAGRRNRLPD